LRAVTLANRVVPRWSLHVSRAGKVTGRRSAVRLLSLERFGTALVQFGFTASSQDETLRQEMYQGARPVQ
jgi:hypothetical protein